MGCGSSRSRRHHTRIIDLVEIREEAPARRAEPDPLEELATLYAKGRIDRDTFLRYRELGEDGRLSMEDIRALREGKLPATTSGDPGLEAELKALSEEIIGVRNRVSALREERARLLAELERASSRAEGALEDSGLEAHDLFKDKVAKEERLRRLETEIARLGASLEKLEALFQELEAERLEAKVDAWAERVARLKGGMR